MQLRLYILLPALLLACIATAQRSDGEGWSAIGIEYELNKRTEIAGNIQARFAGWGTRTKTVFGEAAISREVVDFLKLKLNYRFGPRWGLGGFETTRHRTNLDATVGAKSKDFKYSLRLRYQVESDNPLRTEIAPTRETTVRLRPKVKYKLNKKNDLSLAGELFMPVNTPAPRLIDGYRLGASIEKDLKGGRSFSYGYLYEQPVYVAGGAATHILSLEYNFSFD